MRRLFLLLALAIQVVSAHDLGNIKFEYITSDDGLSQNVVETIFQDSYGFMWFGTRDGLNKYNGISFEIYRHDREDTNSLVSNAISAIAEDAEGRLWIGSDGLNIFDPKLDRFFRIPINPEDEDAFHGGKIYDIQVDHNNFIWIACMGSVVRFNPETEKFKTYSLDNTANLNGWAAFSLCITEDNRVFIATSSDPISEYIRENDSFIEHTYKLGHWGANYKKNIQEDYNGLLYIGAEGAAIHVYNPITNESELLNIGGEYGLNTANVKTKVLPMSKDKVFIGTDGGGINVYNPLEKTMDYLVNDTKIQTSLQSNAVFSLFLDKHENIWVGHYGTGLSVWKRYKEKFKSYYHNPFDSTSLSNGVVTSIHQDIHEKIWIGHDGGGLSLFDEEIQTFRHFRHREGDVNSLTTDVVVCIGEDDAGDLLIGTYGGGLMYFDPLEGKVKKSYWGEHGMSSPHIWDIAQDSEGKIWTATLGAGYDIFNPELEVFENHYSGEDPTVCANVIFSINFASSNEIWFVTENNGICVYNTEDESVTGYTASDSDSNSISSNQTRGIVFQDSLVWIATEGGGLNKLNRKTGNIKVYTTKDGLSSNSLSGLLIDDHNNLWISSSRGLMKFNTETEKIIMYDKTQGLQGNEFKYNALSKLIDGRMAFGGPNGFTIFHPDSISPSPIKADIIFTDFLIFNKSVEIATKNSPLEQNINLQKKLILSHKHKVFRIEYITLDYTTPSNNHYQYMLEGFDDNWVDAGVRNFASYTNLPAGNYTFRVKGSNSDGVWDNGNERSIEIRVRPPWYLTKAFMAFVVITLLYVLFKLVKRREAAAKKEKETLQQKIDQGQEVINSKLKEIQKQQEDIRLRDINEKEIRFHNTGLALFGQIISKSRSDLDGLAQNFISELVNYVGADMGALYIAEKGENGQTLLKVRGRYCMDSKIDTRDGILSGEGYIGTSFSGCETLVVDDLPEGYISLTSGLGSVPIKYSVFQPVAEEKTALGVIEIASVKKLQDYQVEFIGKVSLTIASVLAIENANEQTKQLLEENSKKTEAIMAQEEELRIHIEELQASQEATQRREEMLNEDLDRKNKRIDQLEALLKESKND